MQVPGTTGDSQQDAPATTEPATTYLFGLADRENNRTETAGISDYNLCRTIARTDCTTGPPTEQDLPPTGRASRVCYSLSHLPDFRIC